MTGAVLLERTFLEHPAGPGAFGRRLDCTERVREKSRRCWPPARAGNGRWRCRKRAFRGLQPKTKPHEQASTPRGRTKLNVESRRLGRIGPATSSCWLSAGFQSASRGLQLRWTSEARLIGPLMFELLQSMRWLGIYLIRAGPPA